MSEMSQPSGGHGGSARSSILNDRNRTASDEEGVGKDDRMQAAWEVIANAQAQDCSVP